MAFAVGHKASEGRAGIVELASAEETVAGVSTTTATTPAGVQAAIQSAISGDNSLLGVIFDGANAAGTRTYGAANRRWAKSTDTAAGVDEFANHPCFKGYYALVKYNSETGKAEIIAKEGTAEYEQIKAAGTEDYDEVRMFHVFWYKQTINADGSKSIMLSPIALDGFKPSPMHYRNGVLHEWVGITRYAWGKDDSAVGGMASRAGIYPLTNTTEANFYTKAKSRGLRVFGAKEFSALQMLGCVKYAHQNWQTAVGSGFTSAPASDRTVTVAQTNANSVILPAANAADFPVGASIYLGANNFRTITGNEAYSEDSTMIEVSFDGAPFTSTTSTKVHGGLAINGSADVVQGLDGENVSMHATAARRSIVTLGIENLFGNVTKACSGIVRYDGYMWIKDNPDDDNTWLTASNQDGWTKACPAYNDSEGYIKRFNPTADMGEYDWLSSPIETGGNATNPVGDYIYSNATTTTVYIVGFGGNLYIGAYCGPFCWGAGNGVTFTNWHWGALGVFIPE